MRSERLAIRRIDAAAQRGRLWRAVLVVFFLGFLDGLIRRNNPVEAVLLFHLGEDERLFAGNERKRGAEEIGSVGGHGLLSLAFVHGVEHFGEARLGAA